MILEKADAGYRATAVVATLVALAAAAVTVPASAPAYFDRAEAGYDIDIHEVAMSASSEDNPDSGWLLGRHAELGPHSVRQAWRITTSAPAMDGLIAKYKIRALRPLVLAEFLSGTDPGTQQIPSDLQVAAFCRDVSERFGPGGSGGMTTETAIQYIELGNETTLDKRIQGATSTAIPKALATDYARRVKTCAQNLRRGVKVLVQGPSNYATFRHGHGLQNWIKDMYAAVPDLNVYRGGWTLHPYGPDDDELTDLQADLLSLDSTGEYFLTEYGIATDDARSCIGYDKNGDGKPDNSYNDGWPCEISYAEAARGFATTIDRWKGKYPRIRALWWYQIGDQRDPQVDNLRDHYYGLFQNAGHGQAKEPLKSTVERYVRDLDRQGTVTMGVLVKSSGQWYLSNNIPINGGTGSTDVTPFGFGGTGVAPLTGDWNGDGKTTVGVYRPTTRRWELSNTNAPTATPDVTFTLGEVGDQPVTGDWNGDGRTTVGFYRPSTSTWHLSNNTIGVVDVPPFKYGNSSATTPVAGDWDGDGTTTVGVYAPPTGSASGWWYLSNKNSSAVWDVPAFQWGIVGDQPVTGDWNGDGRTTVGVYRPTAAAASTWYLLAANRSDSYITPFLFGNRTATTPVTGDWDGLPTRVKPPPAGQRCDKTQSSGESFPAFISRLATNEHGCMIAGTYDLAAYDPSRRFAGFKAGQVVKAKANADGRRQAVTVKGELLLNVPGVHLEDFTVLGTNNHAAIDMRAHNLALRYMDVDSSPRNHDTQGIIVGGSELQIRNVVIDRSRVHGHGDTSNFDHGIYCQNTANGRLQGNWIHDNAGYGLHMYTNCDGIDAANNVLSDNGLGIVFANDTSGTTLRNGIVSFNWDTSRPNGIRTSALVNTGNVVRDHAYWAVTNELSGLTASNLDNEDPVFVNRAARDYRLQAASPSREELGSYADAVPGPRT